MNLLTNEQMRQCDKLVIEKYGVPGIVLMENAALRIAEEIRTRYAPLKGQRVAVVCGKGNNGGDGIAVARHLVTREEANVTIWLAEPMDQASPDAAINLMIARNYGIDVQTISDVDWFLAHLQASTVVVDAVLGTGITGDPRPAAAVAIDTTNKCGRPVVSIDVPSGLNADNGTAGSPTVQATVTVTLAMPKLGLYLYPGAALAGECVTVDIGFPQDVLTDSSFATIAAEKRDITTWLPKRSAGRDSNKGKFGAIAIVAGSPGFLGSACLASEGAGRTGAGLVTLAVPSSIFEPAMARAPEPIMTHALASSEDGTFAESAAEEALRFVSKPTSVAFGCGVGHGDSVRSFARRFIGGCNKPLVLDADALTILSLEPDRGALLLKSRKYPTVLTPHPGEMGRLLGISTAGVQADRLKAVREAAAYFGAVVVLKGQATLVAAPDGRLAVNTTGNPGMATGGSGDVLTGVTVTLLSQVDDPYYAVVTAVFIHGLAGDLAAQALGATGILATDIAKYLPAAIASCYE
jgi:ADP-dependent NAD(P)H-hydrate dehydratase / NAD(P)H-hydrate epimerase